MTFNAQTPSVPTEACGEHGICLPDDVTGRHTCVCENGYTGRFCEKVKDNCAEMGNLCRNGGTCVNGNGEDNGDEFYCLCPEGYEGMFCERGELTWR